MKKILCVDNDLSLLHLYKEELSGEGYKVFVARDGKQALEKFQEEKPEAIIMEIRMPVMDGIETMQAMLDRDRQIPIIFNTAFPEYRQNYMTWGAEAYLIKSPDLSELKNKIREVLGKRKKLGGPWVTIRNYLKQSKSRPFFEKRTERFSKIISRA
jgi:DNA-binding response OmpR family regulator